MAPTTPAPDFLLFAPSVIALVALLYSFSVLHIYADDWLSRLPDSVFPPMHTSASSEVGTESRVLNNLKFMDLEKCFTAIDKIPSIHQLQKTASSPSSISDIYALESLLSCSNPRA